MARAVGKLVFMGEAHPSQFGRRRLVGNLRASVAAGSRVSSRHGAKSHTNTSPQSGTRLSPGGASGYDSFVVVRRSHIVAPVSSLEPHMFHFIVKKEEGEALNAAAPSNWGAWLLTGHCCAY
jgi:hypothetical protein